MNIKCGRKSYEVHVGDAIMFNDKIYILMIPDRPVISKALFKKLVREDVIVKKGKFACTSKWTTAYYDRFVFVKEEFDI